MQYNRNKFYKFKKELKNYPETNQKRLFENVILNLPLEKF